MTNHFTLTFHLPLNIAMQICQAMNQLQFNDSVLEFLHHPPTIRARGQTQTQSGYFPN